MGVPKIHNYYPRPAYIKELTQGKQVTVPKWANTGAWVNSAKLLRLSWVNPLMHGNPGDSTPLALVQIQVHENAAEKKRNRNFNYQS